MAVSAHIHRNNYEFKYCSTQTQQKSHINATPRSKQPEQLRYLFLNPENGIAVLEHATFMRFYNKNNFNTLSPT
jgi:hypothetical protein